MSTVAQTLKMDFEKFLKGTETDAEKFAKGFEALFSKAPSVIQTVENFTQEAAPVITAAVTIADPAVEPEVAAALAVAETGLAAIQTAATSANTGGSLLANLQNFANVVPATLKGLQVKNPVLAAAVERIVNLIVGECKVLIPAVEAWVAQIQAAQKAAAAPASA